MPPWRDGQRRPRAGGGCAHGGAWVPPAAGLADRRESVDVISLSLRADATGAAARRRCPASSSCCGCARGRRDPALPQLFAVRAALRRQLSHQRQGRAQRRGGHVLSAACDRATSSTSARRAGASSCSRVTGRSCSSARESARRPCWPCCTPWPRALRPGGLVAARRARRQAHPSPRSRGSLLGRLARGRSHVCYSEPAAARPGQDYDAPAIWRCRCSPSSACRAARTSTSVGPWASWPSCRPGSPPGASPSHRLHTEIFAGGAPMTPGLVATPGARRTRRRRRRHGPLVSFARSGITAR